MESVVSEYKHNNRSLIQRIYSLHNEEEMLPLYFVIRSYFKDQGCRKIHIPKVHTLEQVLS